MKDNVYPITSNKVGFTTSITAELEIEKALANLRISFVSLLITSKHYKEGI